MISIDTILGGRRLLRVAVLAPWILAVSLATAGAQETGEKKRILFLGDSLTIGHGLSRALARRG